MKPPEIRQPITTQTNHQTTRLCFFATGGSTHKNAMVNIQPLTLTDQPLIAGYLKQYPPEISELTFTNLFVWRQSRPIWFAELDGSLVFLTNESHKNGSEKILFGPPTGKASLGEIINFFDGQLAGLVRLPATALATINNSNFHPEADHDNDDYVYQVTDLAKLAGRRYAKKRNHVKQCLQNHHCEYESLTSANLAECEAMQDRWCRSRNCMVEPGLCGEYRAIKETFNHFEKFGLIGGAIRVDSEIKAFAIGEQLNPTTAVCHFEKAMPEVHGLAQLINHWFAKYSLPQFKFINREQDLGIAGLRQSKESYHPHHMVEKFKITLRRPLGPSPVEPINVLPNRKKGPTCF